MADLIIPAALRLWLIFLISFALLGYSVAFSILFGAIGGLAGGVATAWLQIKGGAPSGEEYEDKPPVDDLTPFEGSEANPRWKFPLSRPDKANMRYQERQRRMRERKLRQR